VLIAFGAWLAYWFKEQLALRDDVRLIVLKEVVDSGDRADLPKTARSFPGRKRLGLRRYRPPRLRG